MKTKRLVNSSQMQAMDHNTIENLGVPSIVLMENAARSWVDATLSILRNADSVCVFCGPGNNGGDGYAIARIIQNQGIRCQVIAIGPPKTPDCQKNAEIWKRYGETADWDSFIENPPEINNDTVCIDAILGTGIESELRGNLPVILNTIDKLPGKKLAVDMPSGISASSGDYLGASIKSELTVTFQKEKIGHHLYPGKSFTGNLICQKISIQETYGKTDQPYYLIGKTQVVPLLPTREPDTYKNKLGHTAIWCGSPGTIGAAILASKAAIKTGLGLLTSALPKRDQTALVINSPELMTFPQEEITRDWARDFDALVIGCGLGRNAEKWDLIESSIQNLGIPILFDADAFYGIKNWDNLDLSQAVLTPHAGEFAELSGFEKPATNKVRIGQGLDFVKKTPTTLVLKGAPTLVFSPEGDVFINSSGNAGMATAGSGDVLAGIIGGWLGQGIDPTEAAILGVWLHGNCGDLYAKSHNQESLSASNLVDYITHSISDLRSD